MNDKDKHFIERYEELLDKGYCNCNEMNCIDNNSPKRILNIVKQLQSNWNSLREWCESWKDNDKYCYLASNDKDKCRYDIWEEVLDKMNELEGKDKE